MQYHTFDTIPTPTGGDTDDLYLRRRKKLYSRKFLNHINFSVQYQIGLKGFRKGVKLFKYLWFTAVEKKDGMQKINSGKEYNW